MSVQFSSVPQLCPTLCDPMDCSMPGFSVHHQLLEIAQLLSIESVIPSICLILCCPLLLPPSIFPSIRVFSKESVLHIRWPKCWSFSFSISSSDEYSGLISFSIDWLDLLAVEGTLKSVLQCHSSKASCLQHSAFFIVQLSHPYMPTGKAILCHCPNDQCSSFCFYVLDIFRFHLCEIMPFIYLFIYLFPCVWLYHNVIYHNAICIHPYFCKWQDLFFCGWIIHIVFYCNILQWTWIANIFFKVLVSFCLDIYSQEGSNFKNVNQIISFFWFPILLRLKSKTMRSLHNPV